MPDIYKKNNEIIIEGQCRKCGDAKLGLGDGSGYHAASYRCRKCHAFAGWVSKADMIVLAALETDNPLQVIKGAMDDMAQEKLDIPLAEKPFIAQTIYDKKYNRLKLYADRLATAARLSA